MLVFGLSCIKNSESARDFHEVVDFLSHLNAKPVLRIYLKLKGYRTFFPRS